MPAASAGPMTNHRAATRGNADKQCVSRFGDVVQKSPTTVVGPGATRSAPKDGDFCALPPEPVGTGHTEVGAIRWRAAADAVLIVLVPRLTGRRLHRIPRPSHRSAHRPMRQAVALVMLLQQRSLAVRTAHRPHPPGRRSLL